jgi:hypothetical protein
VRQRMVRLAETGWSMREPVFNVNKPVLHGVVGGKKHVAEVRWRNIRKYTEYLFLGDPKLVESGIFSHFSGTNTDLIYFSVSFCIPKAQLQKEN